MIHLLQIFFFFFVTHAGAGALKEQLKGGDPLAGAIGAVVAETVAESKALTAGDRALEKTMQAACSADHKLSKAEFDALLKENLDTEMHRCVLTGQLAGASAAFLAGRDIASAQSAAQNATENNFALTTAVAVGAGAVLVAANVYDYYQAYTEGGWNAVQAKWDEERALDTSLATAGAGAGIPIGPVGSAVGAAGGAIVGNATLRTKSILQRLIKKATFKTEKKAVQTEFDFVRNVNLGQSGNVGETVVQPKKLAATKPASKQVELDLGKEEGVVGKITKSRGFKAFEDLTLEQKEKLPELIGKVGTYDELRKLTRGYGHYIEAHEIPSWAALKYSGSTKPRGENMAMIVLRKDHVRTSTFGQKNTTRTFAPPRQEFARDLIESTRILKDRGIYNSEYRRELLDATKEEISKNPIYKK